VGAYYYPWYGDFSGGHAITQSLRGHLQPGQYPHIGDYNSRDSATIESHIDQSHQGNIEFWALSWWGPGSAEDRTLRQHLLVHPRASELQYAIHYESTGRFGPFENPDFSSLVPDFRHLADHYFSRDDYLRIDGRPVVFLYVTRAYFNSPESRDALAALRATMQAEYGYNPFIVGDDVFSANVDMQRAALWDALTDFDVYGTALQNHGSRSAALASLDDVYDSALAAADALGTGFIPTASPGFNDSGVREGHPAAPRYLVDEPDPVEGSLFSRMLTDVAVPHVDARVDKLLMINSFNEWHEDTQIEASNMAPATSQDDSGGQEFTQGFAYPGYGQLYLELLRDATLSPGVMGGDMDRDGDVDFDDVQPLVLALTSPGSYEQMYGVAAALHGDVDDDGDLDFDDIDEFVQLLVVPSTSFRHTVPEPDGQALAWFGGCLLLAGWAAATNRAGRS